MFEDQHKTELNINRLLDAELNRDAEHELNRTLIREPEMMRLRDDYRKIDEAAAQALAPIRQGAAVDLNAVFSAGPVGVKPLRLRAHRGWLMIPGAVAAALMAMVIPDPEHLGDRQIPPMTQHGDLYTASPGSHWGGSEVMQPVSAAPRIRRQTGRDVDVIGVVGDDGNLYWIEVERTRTVRWPADSAVAPSADDTM